MLCCDVHVLKELVHVSGTGILLWQYWKCGGSFHSFLTCFAVADTLRSPCCFSVLSLPCTFCASVPIWSLHSTWDWQVPDGSVSASAELPISANAEIPSEEHKERIRVLSPLFPVAFPSVLQAYGPSCCSVIASIGGHSCPFTRSCQLKCPCYEVTFSPVLSEIFQERFTLGFRLRKCSLEILQGV